VATLYYWHILSSSSNNTELLPPNAQKCFSYHTIGRQYLKPATTTPPGTAAATPPGPVTGVSNAPLPAIAMPDVISVTATLFYKAFL
jgi:hypothetical protein